MDQNPSAISAAIAVLRWHVEMDALDVVSETPSDCFGWEAANLSPASLLRGGEAKSPATPGTAPTSGAAPRTQGQPPAARPSDAPTPLAPVAPLAAPPADEAVAEATRIAAACQSLDELKAAVEAFDGCPLKAGARNTVFAEGAPNADLMIIGEAPGKTEDQTGKPFVGRAGALLDNMLAAIGRSRAENAYITNVVFWRPPGNRAPAQTELAMCLPFVARQIEILAPKAILLAGAAPMKALLDVPTGIMRARGAWRDYQSPTGAVFPALPTLHPAYLLRQPAQKKVVWRDLLALKARLESD